MAQSKINVVTQTNNRDEGYASIEELKAQPQADVLGLVGGGTLVHGKAAQKIEFAVSSFDSEAAVTEEDLAALGEQFNHPGYDKGAWDTAASTTMINNGLVHSLVSAVDSAFGAMELAADTEDTARDSALDSYWADKQAEIGERTELLTVGISWKNHVATCADLVAMDIAAGEGALVAEINAFVMRVGTYEGFPVGDDFKSGTYAEGAAGDYLARLKLIDVDGNLLTDDSAIWQGAIDALQPDAAVPSEYVIIMNTEQIEQYRADYLAHFISTDEDEAALNVTYGDYTDVTVEDQAAGDFSKALEMADTMLAIQAGQEGEGVSLPLGVNDRIKRAMSSHMESENLFLKWIRENHIQPMLAEEGGIRDIFMNGVDAKFGAHIERDVVMGTNSENFEGGVMTIPGMDVAHVLECNVFINGLLSDDIGADADYNVLDVDGVLTIDFSNVAAGHGPSAGDEIMVEITNKMSDSEIAEVKAQLLALVKGDATADLDEVVM